MDLLLQLVAVPEGEQTRLGLAVVRWRGGGRGGSCMEYDMIGQSSVLIIHCYFAMA